MKIIGLVLAVLKFVNLLLNAIGHEKAKADGRNEVIAELALNIARKVSSKKAIQEKVDAMSDEELDLGLRDLEPK